MDDLDEPLIWIASHLTGKTRLDKWLSIKLPACSRSQVQKLILDGGVRLNNHMCQGKDLLADGDMISVWYEPSKVSPSASLLPMAIPLAILYEDEHVIVINKPAGLTVHPGAGTAVPTVCAALLAHFAAQGLHLPVDELGGKFARPFIVHRLDRNTTGAMVCAKSVVAYESLKQQFAQKTNTRIYRAILAGVLPSSPLMRESYLGRDPKQRLRFASYDSNQPSLKLRFAKSQFTTTAVFGHLLSEVTVKLYTGRTHQIRVHSKDLQAPVLGDPLYGDSHRQWPQTLSQKTKTHLRQIKRQMLHAEILGFRHPKTDESMTFTAPIPEDFANLLQSLTPYQIGLKSED